MSAPFDSNNILNLSFRNSPYKYSFRSGIYFFELWGADGSGKSPGCGVYVSGTLILQTQQNFIFTLGKKASMVPTLRIMEMEKVKQMEAVVADQPM